MIRNLTALALAAFVIPAAAMAEGSGKTPPGQRDGGSLGENTKAAIEAGFDQGAHSSSFGTPRAGLANVVEKGNLGATLDAIAPPSE